jgi:putative FmdB family regulatory protein
VPLYEYKCQVCGKRHEYRRKVEERDNPPKTWCRLSMYSQGHEAKLKRVATTPQYLRVSSGGSYGDK